MMRRVRGFGVFCVVVLCGLWLQACGEPAVCQNDQQCTAGRICLSGKCTDPSEKPQEPQPAEVVVEPVAEPAAEVTPEAGPEESQPESQAEAQPEAIVEAEPPAIRKEGQTCDPRRLAWWYDRCGTGLACAELRQTSPEDGAPQPVGICLKECSKDNPSACASGTRCVETYDTKTRQSTGIFVCAKQVGDGESCANTQACAEGLTCMRYGTTGTYWVCQKDCSADANACGTGKNCEALSADQPIKACKTARKTGQACAVEDSCEAGATCVPSQLVGVLGRCLKRCGTQTDCATDEVCRGFNGSNVVGVFCFKASETGGACLGGKQCKGNNDLCIPDDASFPLSARCLTRCTNDAGCQAGERCEVVSGTTRACKKALVGGSVLDDQTACATGSRALQISQTTPAICLPDCSLGTATSARLCGVLSAGTLYDLVWLSDQKVLATGALGEIFVSSNAGAAWERTASPRAVVYRGIAAAKSGQLVLVVGERGVILRSEDSGVTWKQVVSSAIPAGVDFVDVALSEDGTAALVIGSKQTVLRSTDEGKTWQTASIAGLASGAVLKAVAVGADQGTAPTPAWMIVGTAATIVRSTDAGQSWTTVTVAGVTEDLGAVALARDKVATGKIGLIGGANGVLLSTTDGQNWQKDTSGTTAEILAVAVGSGKSYASGASGIFLREEAGTWAKPTFPENRMLYGLAFRGANVLASGDGGTVFLSQDDGKTWTAITTALSRCVGLRNSQGTAAGGACLLTCNPQRGGKDCPPELGSCQAISLGGASVNICQPAASLVIAGTAQEGEACETLVRAADSLRCADGLRCLNAPDASGSRCVKPCDLANPACGGGKTCLRLGSSGYCGTSVAKDAACNAADAKLCESGLSCQRDPNAQYICREDPIKDVPAYAPCDNATTRCPSAHLCLGGPETPYRSFCSPVCRPGTNPSGCPNGWDCFSLNNGGGACLERCASADFKCTASFLSCQTISSQGGQHCL